MKNTSTTHRSVCSTYKSLERDCACVLQRVEIRGGEVNGAAMVEKAEPEMEDCV